MSFEIFNKKPIPIPENVDPKIAEVIKACCSYEARARPSVPCDDSLYFSIALPLLEPTNESLLGTTKHELLRLMCPAGCAEHLEPLSGMNGNRVQIQRQMHHTRLRPLLSLLHGPSVVLKSSWHVRILCMTFAQEFPTHVHHKHFPAHA